MNFFKRALKSTATKKGRTVLLIAVFSAILIFVLAGLTIRSAALNATENAKKSVGATVTLSTNRESAMKNATTTDSSAATMTDSSGTTTEEDAKPDPGSFSLTPVNLADAKKIAALDNVKSYSFEVSTSANAGTDITAISSSDSTTEDSAATSDSGADTAQAGGGGPGGDMGGGDAGASGKTGFGGSGRMEASNFQITGVVNTADLSTFSAGTAKMTEGVGLTEADATSDANNVVIESTLADANDLSVGDTFTLVNTTDTATTYSVTVVGIYETSDSGTSMGMKFSFMNPANTIYSSYTFANTVKGEDATGTIDSATYNLENPEDMDAFVKKASALIDTDTYSLQTNDQAYQEMLTPLNNVASFAKNIVILVAVAGVIILTLIVMLMIRERRYEIGVLLSLGESRLKVITQFFTEIVIVMIVALGIASVSGNAVGNLVGQQLLDQQTESAQTATAANTNNNAPSMPGQGGGTTNAAPSGRGGGGMGNMMKSAASAVTLSDDVAKLDIAVKPMEILALAGLALLISLLAILISSIGIIRLNPKKILIS